ncbi:MAG: methylenetetrahydrofolate reductase [Acidimicrobiia bacterium]|nr:methylenetetrahydrofolate reductase [Acidimicrobiia bacterium]
MAKIAELLAAGPTYSFEFPPPRNEEAVRNQQKVLLELEPLGPSFCSVTYGAGGSTRDNTLETVLYIHHHTSMVAMPHLTCVGQTRDEIEGLLVRYRDEGLDNILALAGDLPLEGPDEGDFTYAVELIELARETCDFSVGVAAFPEIHPRSVSLESDRRFLAEKLRLADFAITQFFWTADHYFRMVDELDALGVSTPVIPSLFPVINVATAKRFTAVNGAEWPAWLSERLDPVADDAAEVRKIGIEVATRLGEELLAQDPPGLHIYTMNTSAAPKEVWRNLGLESAHERSDGERSSPASLGTERRRRRHD